MRRLGPKGKPDKDESLIINGPMNLDTTVKTSLRANNLAAGNNNEDDTGNQDYRALKVYDKQKEYNYWLNSTPEVGLSVIGPYIPPNPTVLAKNQEGTLFTDCFLATFSKKLYTQIEQINDADSGELGGTNYSDFTWKETNMTPVVTQTRITFFTPPSKNGRGSSYSGKFYLISDQYNLVTSTNLTAFPSFVKEEQNNSISGSTQAYNFSADSENFQAYADFVEEFCNSDDSEYMLYSSADNYYMDFFHYPISGRKKGQNSSGKGKLNQR